MIFRLSRPDAKEAWQHPEILKRFPRYKGIIDNTQIARYIVAKTIPCDFDAKDSLEGLEALLAQKSKELNVVLNENMESLGDRSVKEKNYIHLVKAIANSELAIATCGGIPRRIIVEVSVIPPPNPAKPVTIPPAKLLMKTRNGLFITYLNLFPSTSKLVLFHPFLRLGFSMEQFFS